MKWWIIAIFTYMYSFHIPSQKGKETQRKGGREATRGKPFAAESETCKIDMSTNDRVIPAVELQQMDLRRLSTVSLCRLFFTFPKSTGRKGLSRTLVDENFLAFLVFTSFFFSKPHAWRQTWHESSPGCRSRPLARAASWISPTEVTSANLAWPRSPHSWETRQVKIHRSKRQPGPGQMFYIWVHLKKI